MGERVPQHVQNLVIRDYCERNSLLFLLSATEYAMDGSHLILEQVLDELNAISGIVFYSLFQLPEESEKRREIFDQIIKIKKVAHFAVEGLSASTNEQFERIGTIWDIKLALSKCENSI